MAGVFSEHLIDSFLSAQRPRGPFGMFASTSTAPQVQTAGPLAFVPQMHGTYNAQQNAVPEPQIVDLSEETARRIATLQAKLNKKLGPEFISQRPGPGGGPKLTYVEGWKIIGLANEVFGFNGWSSSVMSLVTDYVDYNEQSGRFNVGVTAVVRVTLRDGVFHEDVGYGLLENSKSKGAAMDKCKKEAVTDALKRALRNFGNLLGNCLYDKSYTQEIVKIKVPPPKFDKDNLHRRPEFDESRPGPSTTAAPAPAISSSVATPTHMPANPPAAQQMRPPSKPASSISAHVRATIEAATAGQALPEKPPVCNEQSTPVRSNNVTPKGPAGSGLVTPVQTPRHPPQAPARQPSTSGNNSRPQLQPQLQQPSETARAVLADARKVSFAQDAAPTIATNSGPVTGNETIRPDLAADIPEPEDDESYGMNSEDDALFAAVDLTGLDSGIGGHIDFDEGAGGMYVEEEEEFLPPPPPVQAAQSRRGGGSGPTQHPISRRPLQPPAQLPTWQPLVQGRGTTGDDDSDHSSSVRSEASQPRPPSTPSMGGFHFPRGVNTRVGPGNSSGSVSLKRSADAMQFSSARRPLQGMGLAHQPGGSTTSGASRREPLMPLEGGGDHKRVKR